MKRKTDKYEQILTAAIRVFADKGFSQSTISQIAQEAGVADGTIYLYFKNKDDILVQSYERMTDRASDRFWKAVAEGHTAVEKLHHLIHAHLDLFQNDPFGAVVFQSETHLQWRLVHEPISRISKTYRDIVSQVVDLGQKQGAIRNNLYVGLVKRLIFGAVDEVIDTWINTGMDHDLVSMAEPLVDLFIKGIGTAQG
ncbi:MAG: TetR/AcrR family transcriptional regulator [Desulfatitalea sp.]|nr:TetR/AcrR family transcriptional regulator [Desulfatitalea sp.]NNJ99218.1 TetR/AcrR family transcriptional regulator [Desulfatitalea sp.]